MHTKFTESKHEVQRAVLSVPFISLLFFQFLTAWWHTIAVNKPKSSLQCFSSWHGTFYEFSKIYRDVHFPVLYNLEYFHCPKSLSFGIHLSLPSNS